MNAEHWLVWIRWGCAGGLCLATLVYVGAGALRRSPREKLRAARRQVRAQRHPLVAAVARGGAAG